VGDAESGPIRLSFNPQLRVEFRGATVASDAGLLLPRELDERLGLSTLIERHLSDPRTGRNSEFPLADLFRQSIYSRLDGYEDTNDAERVAEDPTFRMLASRERRDTSVALTSTLHWFETAVLAEERTELPRADSPEYGARSARRDTIALATQLREPSQVRKSSPPTMAISSLSAITRFSSSISRATVSQRNCARGTSTVRTAGTSSCCPSLIASTGTDRPWWFGQTPRSPCRRSTRHWNAAGCATPSGHANSGAVYPVLQALDRAVQ
jgi:Transposase DDE domain group 1